MKSQIEIIPASTCRLEVPIVLLHGWGFDRRVWQGLLPVLGEWADVHTVNLSYKSSNTDELIEELILFLPEKFILMGWSLGGMLASRLAAKFPEKVMGLMTLASNAIFVAKPHWPDAMAEETFQQFAKKVQQNPDLGLKRFCKLVAYGDQFAEEQLQRLNTFVTTDATTNKATTKTQEELLLGLEHLAELDNTQHLPCIECPALHVLGQADVLVPTSAVESLRSILPDNHSVQVLTNRGHLLHQPPEEITPLINDFLSGLIIDD